MGKNSLRILAGKLTTRHRWRKDIFQKRQETCVQTKLYCETGVFEPIAEGRASQVIEDVCREAQPSSENEKIFSPVCLCEDDDCCDAKCPVVIWETHRRKRILDLEAAFLAMDMDIDDCGF